MFDDLQVQFHAAQIHMTRKVPIAQHVIRVLLPFLRMVVGSRTSQHPVSNGFRLYHYSDWEKAWICSGLLCQGFDTGQEVHNPFLTPEETETAEKSKQSDCQMGLKPNSGAFFSECITFPVSYSLSEGRPQIVSTHSEESSSNWTDWCSLEAFLCAGSGLESHRPLFIVRSAAHLRKSLRGTTD